MPCHVSSTLPSWTIWAWLKPFARSAQVFLGAKKLPSHYLPRRPAGECAVRTLPCVIYRVAQESLAQCRQTCRREGSVRRHLSSSARNCTPGPRSRCQVSIRNRHVLSRGSGLSGMEERVRLVQGQLSIISAPGQGTTVEVRVTLPESNHRMSKPRSLIADDHQILAEGVRGLLEPEYDVVGVVTDGRELVAAAKKHRPDVIVADITMPSLNGIEAAIQLRDAGIATKVVFLTQHRDVAYARRAMEAGAAGFVLKHSVSPRNWSRPSGKHSRGERISRP